MARRMDEIAHNNDTKERELTLQQELHNNKSDQPSHQNNANSHTQPTQRQSRRTAIRRTIRLPAEKKHITKQIANIMLMETYITILPTSKRHLIVCGSKDSSNVAL